MTYAYSYLVSDYEKNNRANQSGPTISTTRRAIRLTVCYYGYRVLDGANYNTVFLNVKNFSNISNAT